MLPNGGPEDGLNAVVELQLPVEEADDAGRYLREGDEVHAGRRGEIRQNVQPLGLSINGSGRSFFHQGVLDLLGQLGVNDLVYCGLANHVLHESMRIRMLGAPDPRRLEGVQGGSGCRNGVEAYRKPFPPEDATSPPALLSFLLLHRAVCLQVQGDAAATLSLFCLVSGHRGTHGTSGLEAPEAGASAGLQKKFAPTKPGERPGANLRSVDLGLGVIIIS